MKFQTAAELFAFRQLREETLSGVPRFKPGQHKVRMVGNMAQLSYVDIAGNAIMIVVCKRDDEWVLATPTGIRMSHFFMDLVQFPRHFKLTNAMMRAIQAEEAKIQEKGAARGSESRTTPSEG